MAILHGLAPTAIERCRVLEVACGDGANLIPMAYAIPGSEFVGFDLARLPVERAQARIAELGLKNVRILERDILSRCDDLGRFDYIIAHGFYAWTPAAVRDRLLQLCGEALTADGIAFISYNAKPAGHVRSMIREMMLQRVEGIDDLRQQVAAGIEFLRSVAESRPQQDVYRELIEKELKRLEPHDPGVTGHDELSEAYEPVQFTEFVQHARRHELAYLDEAVLPPPTDPVYREDVRRFVDGASGGDFIKQEQLLDFVRMRGFRETLLVRAGSKIERDVSPQSFRRLLLASQATPAAAEKPGSRSFVLPGGVRMESNHPAITALLEKLGNVWPSALSFQEIEPMLAENGLILDSDGAALLIRLAVAQMIELRSWHIPVAPAISERPKASAYARQEARMHGFATSLLHTRIALEDEKTRHLLEAMDGSRDRGGLFAAMSAAFPEMAAEELQKGLEQSLRLLQRAGVLEA